MRIKRIVLYLVLVFIIFAINFYLRPISGNKLVTEKYKNSSAYINDLYMSDEYFKKNILDEEDYYIYDVIIKASLKDKNKVRIECHDDCSNKLINSYYALYLDHPELISFVGLTYYTVDNGEISFENYGNLSQIKYFFGVRRIEREIDIIKRETKNMTEKEKIIYTYDYVASHNYDRFFTSIGANQSAYSFFTKKSSVCAGFAKASQIIFQNIGIKSYLALSSDHMWNYVEYKGKYYIFDATVGTSYYEKKTSRYYEGLGRTTTGVTKGMYSELYPEIEEETTLKEIFGV
jgi:transglutaminase/protease-like cytokinesis protein 3